MEKFSSAPRKIRYTDSIIHKSETVTKSESQASVLNYTCADISSYQTSDWNNRFTVMWIKSGQVTLIEGKRVRIINANSLFCLLPGHHSILVAAEDIDTYLVSFSEDFLLMTGGPGTYPFSLHYADRHTPCPVIDTTGDMGDGLENVMRLVVRNFDTSCHFDKEIFRGMLQILAVYFSRGGEVKSESEKVTGCDEKIFSAFTRLLEASYTSKKSVCEYATELAVSPTYLSDAIRRVSGYTASFFIHQRIIRAAKSAAIGPSTTMKEVASQVGFTDIAHFSKFFRTQTGLNFTDYKKMIVS